jgi:tRNA (guanine-N7-)-methyltransferase
VKNKSCQTQTVSDSLESRTSEVIDSRRVPITHPDFRYSESTNPYSKKIEEVSDRVFSDQASEAHIGQWRDHFPDQKKSTPQRRPLHVEIGCNAGHVILEWAKAHPETSYIGIDWKFKPIFRAAEKSIKHKIGNLIFLRAHADRIQYIFSEEEVDALFLFFPDPWPKKAQKKNRFLRSERLREIHKILSKDGVFTIRTDHRDYFDWMLQCIHETQELWDVFDLSFDVYANHPDPKSLKIPEVTLFERLFIKDGLPIHQVKLRKRLPTQSTQS